MCADFENKIFVKKNSLLFFSTVRSLLLLQVSRREMKSSAVD